MAVKTNYKKNGSDYFRVTTTVGKTNDGKPIRKEFYGKSKSDAEDKRDEYLNNLKNGLEIDYKDKLLGELLHTWLFEVVRVSTKASTFERYEGIYRNYIKESNLFSLKVYEIKSLQVQRYYNELFDNGKSSNIIKNLNKLLKMFFNYAFEEGYILKNPCTSKRIVIPKNDELLDEDLDEAKDLYIFSDEEIIKFKDALIANRLKALFLLALGTGLRQGELLGLRWSDINYESKELKVQRSVKRVTIINSDESREGKLVVQIPKTKGSIRTVTIPSTLIPVLEKHRLIQGEEKLKFGDEYLNKDGYVFTTKTGFFIDSRNLLRAYKRALKKADIEYRKFHNLRHTYATKLFEKDVPLKTVQELLGHSDISMTANIYTHVMPAKKTDAAEKLNQLFS